MKTKIVLICSFFGVSLFLVPFSSHAIAVPTANVTIVVNTQKAESLFNFTVQQFYNNDWQIEQQFGLQTQNLTSSKTVTVIAYSEHLIKEQVPSGIKLANIHCASDNPADFFYPESDGISFSPNRFSNIICIFDNVINKSKTPVLIVPGIMMTEIKSGNELLWPDLEKLSYTTGDGFMDDLAFSNNLVPSVGAVSIGNIIKKLEMAIGLVKFNYTDGLINEFVSQGYKENETLFTFPYDWRYGVSGKYTDGTTNVDLLKQKIADILQQTGADKIDVVAHSNGGLLVKKYVADNPTSHKIGKAIFVGVPNTGAPKAVKVLLFGDNMGIPFLNDQEIQKISVNMPSSYDLLPSQKYYNIAGSFVSVIDSAKTGQTQTDLDYNQFGSFLTADHSLNAQGLSNSELLHTQAFDDFDLRTTGVDLYNIVGCRASTITSLVETRIINTQGVNNGLSYSVGSINAGDNTVPIQSSTNLPVDQNKKFYALNADHGKMPSQDGIRQEIVNLISGSSLVTGKNIFGNDLITQDVSKCQLNGKAIEVFSPVDLTITDQSGNKLGLAEDKSTINEIPNADFEILGESASTQGGHKFIYLPTDEGQIYAINMQGTGSGTYTINVKGIENTNVTKIETFNNLPVTDNLTGSINLGSNTIPTTLSVKKNSNSKAVTIYSSQYLPTNKDQCKNDGWKNFGSKFKNQGGCVSYVETGKLK